MDEKSSSALLSEVAAQTPSDPPPDYTTAVRRPSPSSGSQQNQQQQQQKLQPPKSPKSPTQQPTQRRPPPPLKVPILDHLRAHRVILASASPRRRALLAQVGLPRLEIWPSTLPEDVPKSLYGPYEYVAATARQKCLHVYQEALAAQEEAVSQRKGEDEEGQRKGGVAAATDLRDPELVIAADTVIVSRGGKIIEKPRSEAEHGQMLRHLRDTRTHTVLTAVCVLSPRQDAAHPGYAVEAHTEETKVVFASELDGLSDAVIDSYVRTREGADKAGGYALQGTGGLVLVERIEGSFDNVIGLPVRKVLQLAEKVIFQQNEEEIGESDIDEE